MNQQPPAHHDLTDGWMDKWMDDDQSEPKVTHAPLWMDGWMNEWMDDDQSEPKVTHAALWMDGR
jgi:hypothetical protein